MQIHVNTDTYVLLLFYISHCFCVISNDPLTILNKQYAPGISRCVRECIICRYIWLYPCVQFVVANAGWCVIITKLCVTSCVAS